MTENLKLLTLSSSLMLLLALPAGASDQQHTIKIQNQKIEQPDITEKWSSDDVVALDEDVPTTTPSFITQTFPRLEVRTSKDNVKVIAELPGVRPENLELIANSDALLLAGKRAAVSNDKVIVSELPTGTFKRRVRLPHPVLVGQSVATIQDGILTVTMPRCRSAESQQKISISISQRRYQ